MQINIKLIELLPYKVYIKNAQKAGKRNEKAFLINN